MGKTGSGKTYFTRQLVRRLHRQYPFAHVYIYDGKAAGDFDELSEFTIRSTVPPTAFKGAREGVGGLVVWQPPSNRRGPINQWFKNIYEAREPAIVWNDDVAILATKTYTPEYFDVLQKVGRGLNICMVNLVQESVDIPRTILSQATHLVTFRLSNDYDKRMIKQKLELKRDYAVHHKYGFWHTCLDDTDDARYYGSFESFF